MLKIGITGGIGSGKTTVCKLFELLGVPVYYADEASRKLLVNDAGIKQRIIHVLGKEALDEQQQISRKKIAALVFGHPENLKQLNAIMHPAVAQDFSTWLKNHEAFPYIIKEAAVMFESGAHLQLDQIITVTAPEELRITRVIRRDGVQREEIVKRMQAQLTDAEKIKRAQFVIVNDEKMLVIPQVLKLHDLICNM